MTSYQVPDPPPTDHAHPITPAFPSARTLIVPDVSISHSFCLSHSVCFSGCEHGAARSRPPRRHPDGPARGPAGAVAVPGCGGGGAAGAAAAAGVSHPEAEAGDPEAAADRRVPEAARAALTAARGTTAGAHQGEKDPARVLSEPCRHPPRVQDPSGGL